MIVTFGSGRVHHYLATCSWMLKSKHFAIMEYHLAAATVLPLCKNKFSSDLTQSALEILSQLRSERTTENRELSVTCKIHTRKSNNCKVDKTELRNVTFFNINLLQNPGTSEVTKHFQTFKT